VGMSGADHAQTFEVKCSVAVTQETCNGVGISRKKAEQAAAENMLNLLQTRDK